ncbi:MAG: hypothetical protein ACI8X5_003529 [Planctomycetota bacterium]|jgi:hypothetical protein
MFRRLVSLSFLAIIFGVPLGQAGWEFHREKPLQALDVFGSIKRSELAIFERDLREASFIHTLASGYHQWLLFSAFGHGNQKAVVGNDGWVYYGRDLDLVTSDGFLSGDGAPALEAILDFRDQLEARGVELLLLPVPAKAAANPEHFSSWTSAMSEVENQDSQRFFEILSAKGVHVVQMSGLYRELRGDQANLYLANDTHWTPSTMAQVAKRTAEETLRLLGDLEPSTSPSRWKRVAQEVSGPGDMLEMMRLPKGVVPFDSLELTTQRVIDAGTGEDFERAASAEVLLLGDSFSGVFGDAQLGFGEGAGLCAQLAFELNLPLDSIVIAGGSARAVRERLARRPGGVSGKKVVIWQISERDLIEGDDIWGVVPWPDVPLLPTQAPQVFGTQVLAQVVEVSRIPDGFDYSFCLGVVEYRVEEIVFGELPGGPLWIAHVLMVDYELVEDASPRVGERYRIDLELIEEHFDLDETSWVDDTDAGYDIWFATELEKVE